MGWFDRFLGLLLGTFKAYIICSVIYMVLGATLSSTNTMLKRSKTGPYLAEGAQLVRKCINDARLRDFMQPKKPAIELKLDESAEAEKKVEAEK